MKGFYCLMQDKYIAKRRKGKHLTLAERESKNRIKEIEKFMNNYPSESRHMSYNNKNSLCQYLTIIAFNITGKKSPASAGGAMNRPIVF